MKKPLIPYAGQYVQVTDSPLWKNNIGYVFSVEDGLVYVRFTEERNILFPVEEFNFAIIGGWFGEGTTLDERLNALEDMFDQIDIIDKEKQ